MLSRPTWLRYFIVIAITLTTLLSHGWQAQSSRQPSAEPTFTADDDGAVHRVALTQGEVKVTPPAVQVRDNSTLAKLPVQRQAPPNIASHPLARVEAVDNVTPRRTSVVGLVELRI